MKNRKNIIEELPDFMKKSAKIKPLREILNLLPTENERQEIDSDVISFIPMVDYISIFIDCIHYRDAFRVKGNFKWFKKILNKVLPGSYIGEISLHVLTTGETYYFNVALNTKSLSKMLNKLDVYSEALHQKYTNRLQKEKYIQRAKNNLQGYLYNNK